MKRLLGLMLLMYVGSVACEMTTIVIDDMKKPKYPQVSNSSTWRDEKRKSMHDRCLSDNRVLHASRVHKPSKDHNRKPSMEAFIVLQYDDDSKMIMRQFFQAVYLNNVEKASTIWTKYNNENGSEDKTLSCDDCNKDGSYLLHVAVRSPYCGDGAMNPMIDFLLKTVKCAINVQDKSCRTPLHYLAYNGDYKEAEKLLLEDKNKQLINAVDLQGNTALHYAVLKKKSDMVTLLLHYDAWVMTLNRDGKTPLDMVIFELAPQEITTALQKKAEEQAEAVRRQDSCCHSCFSVCLHWLCSCFSTCCCSSCCCSD